MKRRLLLRDQSTDVWIPDMGSWRPLEKADGTRSASVACGECGKSSTLTDHTIKPNGDVSPSLQCPHEPCPWHVNHITLEGW